MLRGPRSVAYTATKHAMTGLTKSTRSTAASYNIACGQIDIGNAATPLTERMVQGTASCRPTARMAVEPRMDADDVGRAVVYMASLPLDTNVLFMTVMANVDAVRRKRLGSCPGAGVHRAGLLRCARNDPRAHHHCENNHRTSAPDVLKNRASPKGGKPV